MGSQPRLTAADAETLLVSAGFQYLDRRGHHRIYGRARTRVIVPFDGRPELHPKVVRMIVESMERSRPTVSFEVDKTLVGGASAPIGAGAWVAAPGEPTLEGAMEADLTGEIAIEPPKPEPPKATAAKPTAKPGPNPASKPSDTLVIPADPAARPAGDKGAPEDINLPRRPKGAWS